MIIILLNVSPKNKEHCFPIMAYNLMDSVFKDKMLYFYWNKDEYYGSPQNGRNCYN